MRATRGALFWCLPQPAARRYYLNLSAAGWRQLRRNWRLPASPILLWETFVPGSMLAVLSGLQRATYSAKISQVSLDNALVILGYWRSGTTLLHELLGLDGSRCYPTTYAAMNPHHFLMTEASALSRDVPAVRRPMDDMEIRPSSPQEDEFALLAMGARSPYEALIAPSRLAEALLLGDPRDLGPAAQSAWRAAFLEFARGVVLRGGNRPLALKSPTHGYRAVTLRELLPNARFIVLARDPSTHFESVVRMWRRMFETYSLEPLPPEDEIRYAILKDRGRYEAKVAEGIAGLPENRLAMLKYEDLVANPLAECERLYRQLDLGDFDSVRPTIAADLERRRDYRSQSKPPAPQWRTKINDGWSVVFERYNYQRLSPNS